MLFLFLVNNFKIWYTWMKTRFSPSYYWHLVLSFVCHMLFSNGFWAVTWVTNVHPAQEEMDLMKII